MPPKKPARKKSTQRRKGPSRRKVAPRTAGAVSVRARDIHCADFVGRDQAITYGYTAQDLERLIEKVLAFVQQGAAFSASQTGTDSLRAELNGETLTFRPGAVTQLAGRRDERSYLLSLTVRQDYLYWATNFIPLAAHMDVQSAITALTLPVAYSEFRVPHEGEAGALTAVPLEDITEALNKYSAFIILGEPGAGKTTTLQKIAFEAARARLSTGAGRVPLFVRLSQQGVRDPFGNLQEEWQRRTGTDFADALAEGRVLVLADGVNELGRGEDYAERLKAWRLFVSDYVEANQILFTSREKDYDRQLDLPRVRVDPLDDARIADYLKRNQAEGFRQLLDEGKNTQTQLRTMARNPFNLALLVRAYKSNQGALSNRGRLLEWFVGELFAREEKLAHRSWLHRDSQSRVFAQLAYAMQLQGESTAFPLKTARAALPATVEEEGDDVPLKAADLFRCGRAATILDPAAKDIRFYHQLLQEYFAALELLRRLDVNEDLSNLWRCKRLAKEMPPAEVGEWDPLPEPPPTGWEVTTILACGMAPDPAQLIEALRPINPNLAGRCLHEAGIGKPEAVADRVRADLLADLYNPAVHLRARLQAGFTLGHIGDPRFVPQVINGVKVIVPHMVNVPAGKYIIGSTDDDPESFVDEKPQHAIDLPAFAIGKWPVTNAEYACFIEAGGYQDERWWETELARRWLRSENVAALSDELGLSLIRLWEVARNNEEFAAAWKAKVIELYPPQQQQWLDEVLKLNSKEELLAWIRQDDQIGTGNSHKQPQRWNDVDTNNPSQPVVGITWFEANAYCVWLSATVGHRYRLPTEFEWEAAARGPRGLRYPWGNSWDFTKANTIESRVFTQSPVGAYTAAGNIGPFSAEDQAGNVHDWTSSLYQPYPYLNADRRGDSLAESERVIRGGSWTSPYSLVSCVARTLYAPYGFGHGIGVRLAASVA